MDKVVLFCSGVYTSIGVIRCLGEVGYKPECYCYGDDSDYLLASRYISVGKKFPTIHEVLAYLLNDYPKYDKKPILLTIPDPPAYYVDLHKAELEKKFVVMSAGKSGAIVYWMSKKNIGALAVKNGLTIPWTIEQNKSELIPDGLEYPVFTKSVATIEGGKGDESICYNKMELEERKKYISSDRFLIMKYVEKAKEINYFGMSLKGHVYINYKDERTRFLPGSYGHYSKFMACEKDELYLKIVSLIKDTGYEGLFDVEFIQGTDGELYFLEVNFRVDGTVYRLSPGVNLPAEWCRLVNTPQDELPSELQTGKNVFTGMSEYQDFKDSVIGGKVNVFVWLYQFLKADKHATFNIKDPKPFFYKVFERIKH